MRIRRDKTALRRVELSRPIRIALDSSLLPGGTTLFDYGCGHGTDARLLRGLGFAADGWDPAHAPDAPKRVADVVNLGFVLNVIEDPAERVEATRSAWSLTKRLLIVSARLRSDVDTIVGEDYSDGVLTRGGTFQHFYTQLELRDWLEAVLGERPVPAAPGVFFVFRAAEDRERFVATRFRRSLTAPRPPVSALLYAEHKELLDPLISFFSERGRVPHTDELPEATGLCSVFGSIPRAFAVVRRATGPEQWQGIELQRREDLLLYLAAAQFNRPPRFSDLAPELRNDIRTFHGSYSAAQQAAVEMMRQVADQELINIACKSLPVGKETPQAVYLHVSCVSRLPTILRLYEACARGLIGEMDGANIVKLHRYRPQVSYLSYPTFDKQAHPALAASAVVNLDEVRASFRDYASSNNPPILHRKEEFVPDEYPGRAKFAALTAQEERAGLYLQPHRIGSRRDWSELLAAQGLQIRGHRLSRRAGGD